MEQVHASKTQQAAKNAVWAVAGKLISDVLGFVSRTFFIKYLGTYYLGLNSLFGNILSVLSLAELGIGSAITFSLYKPLTNNDTEKIKSLMRYYRVAYSLIALVIAVLGLALMPFLQYIVSNWAEYSAAGTAYNLYFVYLIILATTTTSYLLAYKRTLIIADQKEYVVKNFTAIFSIISHSFQIIFLILTKNFYVYLIVCFCATNLSNICLNFIVNKKYPYLKDKKIQKLEEKERKTISKNVRALVIDKLGSTFIYQTDSIITSAMISAGTIVVGIVSNYNTIITMLVAIVNLVVGAAQAGLGHLIATSTAEVQHKVFKTYRFIHFWESAFVMVCIFALIQPFMRIWLMDEQSVLGLFPLSLIVLSTFLNLERGPILYIKIAGGVFNADKWLSLIMGVVNIIISVVMALWIGLAGIYVGTIASTMIALIVRPLIVYKHIFKCSPKDYFVKWFEYTGFTIAAGAGVYLFVQWFTGLIGFVPDRSFVSIMLFLAMCGIAAILVNGALLLCFGRTEEFKQAVKTIKNVFLKGRNKRLQREAAAETNEIEAGTEDGASPRTSEQTERIETEKEKDDGQG